MKKDKRKQHTMYEATGSKILKNIFTLFVASRCNNFITKKSLKNYSATMKIFR